MVGSSFGVVSRWWALNLALGSVIILGVVLSCRAGLFSHRGSRCSGTAAQGL